MSLTLTRRYNVDRFGYLIPTQYGNVPMMGAVATYRPGEGRFGRGAVAVEEGTTNLVVNPTAWKSITDEYQTTTETTDRLYGCVVSETVKLITSTPPSTLASLTIAPGETYTASIYVQKVTLGGDPAYPQLIFYKTGANQGMLATSDPAADTNEWQRLVVTYTNDTDTSLPVLVLYYSTCEVGAITRQAAPQVEKKPFATSFVDGTRAVGELRYTDTPAGGDNYTIALWAKTSTNNPSTWQGLFDDRLGHSRAMLAFSTGDVLTVFYSNGDGTSISRSTGYAMLDRTGWHLYALTFSGPRSSGTFRVYVDGMLVYAFQDSLQSPTSGGAMYVGRGSPVSELWNGLIDELLILPYAASEGEIVSWYEAQGLLPPHPQALLQWDRQTVRPAQMVKL